MRKFQFLFLVLFSLFMTSCVNSEGIYDDSNNLTKHEAALTVIPDCAAYKDYVLDTAAREIAELRYGYYLRVWDDVQPGDPEIDKDNAGEFTTTNVQEGGVDEMDSIKNDSKYFYLVNENSLYIVEVWPPSAMLAASRLDFIDNERAHENTLGLFLYGDLVVVMSSYWAQNNNPSPVDGWDYYYGGHQMTRASFINVKDRKKPVVVKSYEFPSALFAARLVGSQLYLALNHTSQPIDAQKYASIDIPGTPKAKNDMDWERGREYIAKYTPVIREYLAQEAKTWDVEALFPKISVTNADKSKAELNYVTCDDFYLPATASKESGLLSIVTINVDELSKIHSTTIADSSWLLYASQNNIYLVSNSNSWFWFPVFNDMSNRRHFTQIHQFKLDPERSRTQYLASGEISGLVNNSFWLSEYNDHLRVASQAGWWNDEDAGNTLTVLKREGGILKETGKITNIAKGESIYAARMFGDKGYLVTFKRIDPLFTMDLSNPNDPKIMGELKINGYSSYIHPISNDHLLTIGEDSDDEGRVLGLHLQIFDVRDMKDPKRVHHELLQRNKDSHTYSDALYDHHAFSYHAGSETLVIPYNEYNWSAFEGKAFSGMLVYKASADKGFTRLGMIDHAGLIHENVNVWWTNLTRSRIYFGTAGVYDKDAYVYTLSNYGLKVNDLNDLSADYPVVRFE
ncbi:MAG: beta-propeller domain-containing protein [Bradymonadales bacterium]